jgi:glycosyltransferase involved in cell wall biosynthesis
MNLIFSINSKPLITVVVPCYNSGKYLPISLQSVLKQSYRNFEIILVNVGTTCKITKKILKFYRKNKFIKIVNQENKGLPSARNRGIQESLGEYIFFLDSDDSISKDCLEKLFNLIKNKKNIYSYPSLTLTGLNIGFLNKNYNFFEQLFSNQIPYSCLYPKNLLVKLGGYDEKMKDGFEDWELNIRMGINNFHGICSNEKLFYYNVSNVGMLQSISLKKYYQIYEYIRVKHSSIYSIKNLLAIYQKNKNKKSTHSLKLYFIYYFYLKILPNKILNYLLRYVMKLSHTTKVLKKNKKYSDKKVSKVLHVITSSDLGGAEKSLRNLIINTPSLEHQVIILKYKNKISVNFGVDTKVFNLNMHPKRISFFKIFKLYRLLLKLDYQVINTWLYHSDFIISFCSLFLFKKKRIVWSIHNNNLDSKVISRNTKIIVFFCKLMSYFSPSLIICTSKSALKNHIDYGYNKKIMHFNPPIFFQDNYKKKIKFTSNLKNYNNKNKKPIMLGCLARWNVQKNQLFLIDCLSELRKKGFKFHLLMAGSNVTKDNSNLVNFIKEKKLINHISLLGEIKNVRIFFEKIDLNILPSLSESFPLVINEASFFYTPSLASDVGDVSKTLNNSGWVFKSNNKKSFTTKFKQAYKIFFNKNLWKLKRLAARNAFDANMKHQENTKNYVNLLTEDY